jgi:zinc D-Ala-D-Ala carboxypeptidase
MKDAPEIPTARREYAPVASKSKSQALAARRGMVLAVALVAGVSVGAVGLWLAQPKTDSVAAGPPLDPAPPATGTATPVTGLLEHHPYAEAPQRELDLVGRSGEKPIYMRQKAAAKFQAMQAAAKRDGVNIIPISGFRDIAYQTNLFNRNMARLGGVEQARKVSAPPGYSEHHTGYALDLGDGNAPQTAVEPSFEKTRAFRWLKNNALRFGFEISFDRGNAQDVNYEPWHWRFVGDKASLETFYGAASGSGQTSPTP